MTLLDKLAWNGLLLILCFVLSVALIQHAMFFYAFPPDLKLAVSAPIASYIWLMALLFLTLKTTHYMAESGELLKDEEDAR